MKNLKHLAIMSLFILSAAIEDVSASSDGLLYCSVAADKALKVFDVVNFGTSILIQNTSFFITWLENSIAKVA